MAKHIEPARVRIAAYRSSGGRFGRHTPLCIAIVIAVVAGALVLWSSPLAFLAAATDGVLAVTILAAAALAGLWVVWGTGNGDLPIGWQIALGAGFGTGALSLGMLWAGMHAYLGRTTWLVILGVLAAAGLVALQRMSQRPRELAVIAAEGEEDSSARHWRWLWLLVVPAIVLGVLAATVPPGILWYGEGYGFDVLEYHLGVPKEYFVSGRITYLDHNMYSNFPMNAEMLYLLTMVLHGSPFQAAVTAQMIHLLLGALAGYVAWLIGRDYSRKAGIVAGVAGAAFPWSVYLGALAYVENGMLFYGLLAAGLCNRAIREPCERRWPRALALGAMIGLACGYKYTAIPMIAAPLLGLWVVLSVKRQPARFAVAVIPLAAAAALFGPWMVKDQRMTGDPFFPLGYRVFGSRVWNDADYAKFVQGHSLLPEERPAAVRLGIFRERVIADSRFGWMPWAAAGLAAWLAVSRRRFCRGQTLIWLAMLAMQILVWLFTTHLFARFASMMWVPLVMLIATAAAWLTAGSSRQRDRGQPTTTMGLQQRGACPERSEGTMPPASGSRQTGRRGDRETRGHGDRAWPSPSSALCLVGLLVYLVVGLGGIFREYRQRMYVQGRLLPVQGNTDVFVHGDVSDFDQLEFINGDGLEKPGLPRDARLLMVNDVCGYYVDRPYDYCVTFSRDRFARAVEESGGSADRVLDWLRRQGYTHVWVNLAGMGQPGDPRIQVPPQITPDLFARLEGAGLKRLRVVRAGNEGPVHGILYEVPGY